MYFFIKNKLMHLKYEMVHLFFFQKEALGSENVNSNNNNTNFS